MKGIIREIIEDEKTLCPKCGLETKIRLGMCDNCHADKEDRKRTFEDFCDAMDKLYGSKTFGQETDSHKQLEILSRQEKFLTLIREYRHEILDAMLEKELEDGEQAGQGLTKRGDKMNPFADAVIKRIPKAKLTEFEAWDGDKSVRTIRGVAFCVKRYEDFLGCRHLEFAEVFRVKPSPASGEGQTGRG